MMGVLLSHIVGFLCVWGHQERQINQPREEPEEHSIPLPPTSGKRRKKARKFEQSSGSRNSNKKTGKGSALCVFSVCLSVIRLCLSTGKKPTAC